MDVFGHIVSMNTILWIVISVIALFVALKIASKVILHSYVKSLVPAEHVQVHFNGESRWDSEQGGVKYLTIGRRFNIFSSAETDCSDITLHLWQATKSIYSLSAWIYVFDPEYLGVDSDARQLMNLKHPDQKLVLIVWDSFTAKAYWTKN